MIRASNIRRRLAMAAFVAAIAGMYGLSPSANATEDPIPLIDVVVRKTPPGNGFTARTDDSGRLVFKYLARGTYVVADGKGNKKTFVHPGGPVQWRLVKADPHGAAVWTLVDDTNPL